MRQKVTEINTRVKKALVTLKMTLPETAEKRVCKKIKKLQSHESGIEFRLIWEQKIFIPKKKQQKLFITDLIITSLQ